MTIDPRSGNSSRGTPGYFTLGRLFANGYLKALLKGTEKNRK
jgi:D-mannonate dehydratase